MDFSFSFKVKMVKRVHNRVFQLTRSLVRIKVELKCNSKVNVERRTFMHIKAELKK